MSKLLPPATARLWHLLSDSPALGGFYLLGGTALTLRIGHRQSEDLDFAWPEPRLPRARLEALGRELKTRGWHLKRDDSPGAYDEFLVAGMELHDYQQDFLASDGQGSVKVSFFSPSSPLSDLLRATNSESVEVADLKLLFQSKALVSAERSASRDWLDLFILMTRHGFSMKDYATAFLDLGAGRNLETGIARLLSGQPRLGDAGFEALMKDPPSLDEITRFFKAEIAKWQQDFAGEKLRDSR